ncbi:MAG: RtcB family protein, partial [Flavobacterium sp.]
MENTITGTELLSVGYKQNEILGAAIKLANSAYSEQQKEDIIAIFKKVIDYPENFLDDEVLGTLAANMIEEANAPKDDTIALIEESKEYTVYGSEHIEKGARDQMDIAMRLPVAVAGALMPDAHQGYGLPIGGVLATRNAIIPYGVGVDIGCRMALSVYDIPAEDYIMNESKYKRELIAHTKFGAGHGYHGQHKASHDVIDRPEFGMNKFIKNLQDKAWSQLGTSGGGNHFVEFGIIEFEERDEVLGIDKGRYVALLTHSGSRGFGAT